MLNVHLTYWDRVLLIFYYINKKIRIRNVKKNVQTYPAKEGSRAVT